MDLYYPSSFQHLMDKLFCDLPFVTCYLDSMLVHSADVRLHEKHLKEVFPDYEKRISN